MDVKILRSFYLTRTSPRWSTLALSTSTAPNPGTHHPGGIPHAQAGIMHRGLPGGDASSNGSCADGLASIQIGGIRMLCYCWGLA